MPAKILLIEDDPNIVQMYTTKFKEKKHEVVYTLNGLDALEMAEKEKPDIILLDIIIPQMDGFAVLKVLKETPGIKNIPVILLTNLGQESDKEKGTKLGAADYLIKANFTPSQVLEKVEGYLKK